MIEQKYHWAHFERFGDFRADSQGFRDLESGAGTSKYSGGVRGGRY
jgi:hypothetical protein